ncbi:hypothetical protein EU537_00500 [Candidatus Thorarchaeota archaeon]|nr:MAG: hypothetical protein EU537_00500 [Candidatus Thorarchaeota archaeon]
MASVLLTTSRRTSDRVRSFVRDLAHSIPDSVRFNRGSMNMVQLQARIKQVEANAAIIVSMFRGNPGELSFIDDSGGEILNIRMESAALRREVSPDSSTKNISCLGVAVKEDSSKHTLGLAKELADLFNVQFQLIASPYDVTTNHSRHSFLWFEDLNKGKILWTHYVTDRHTEIGPRIRISSLRRG